MAIGKLNRDKPSSPEEFITKGGSSSIEGNGHTKPNDEVRMTLRCPGSLIEKLDTFRKSKPGRVSRNQAIIELLDSGLSE